MVFEAWPVKEQSQEKSHLWSFLIELMFNQSLMPKWLKRFTSFFNFFFPKTEGSMYLINYCIIDFVTYWAMCNLNNLYLSICFRILTNTEKCLLDSMTWSILKLFKLLEIITNNFK